jgi:hypothetical protein
MEIEKYMYIFVVLAFGHGTMGSWHRSKRCVKLNQQTNNMLLVISWLLARNDVTTTRWTNTHTCRVITGIKLVGLSQSIRGENKRIKINEANCKLHSISPAVKSLKGYFAVAKWIFNQQLRVQLITANTQDCCRCPLFISSANRSISWKLTLWFQYQGTTAFYNMSNDKTNKANRVRQFKKNWTGQLALSKVTTTQEEKGNWKAIWNAHLAWSRKVQVLIVKNWWLSFSIHLRILWTIRDWEPAKTLTISYTNTCHIFYNSITLFHLTTFWIKQVLQSKLRGMKSRLSFMLHLVEIH